MPDSQPRDPLTTVRTERRGTALVVEVTGELDIATTPEVADRLHAAVDHGASTLVVDLAGVTFCGVAGLTMLGDCQTRAEASDVRMTLAGCRPDLLRVMRLARVIDRFAVSPTASDAVDGPIPGQRRQATTAAG